MASPGQSGGKTVDNQSQVFPPAFGCCIDLLHDLNNVLAAVLTNAQVLDGKLPSYSRSKRYIHEIERGAQRGGVLIKRLLRQLPAEHDQSLANGKKSGSTAVPPVTGSTMAVANQGSPAAADGAIQVPHSGSALAAPAFRCAGMSAHRNM